jgi:hypothetical protein
MPLDPFKRSCRREKRSVEASHYPSYDGSRISDIFMLRRSLQEQAIANSPRLALSKPEFF